MLDVADTPHSSGPNHWLDALDRIGAVIVATKLDLSELEAALPDFTPKEPKPGRRLFSVPDVLARHMRRDGVIGELAKRALSPQARPTRVLLFDKSAASNWAVPWHQDRTIAVKAKAACPGFETWTIKEGVPHVEPPWHMLERTLSLRLHLDPVTESNAPLMSLKGSHQLGRVPTSQVQDCVRRGEIETHLAAPGDLLILRTSILHASNHARSVGRRRVIHIDYCDADLPYGLDWALDWTEASCS